MTGDLFFLIAPIHFIINLLGEFGAVSRYQPQAESVVMAATWSGALKAEGNCYGWVLKI